MSASATDIMRNYATTQWPFDNHKSRIWKLKRFLGWTERRVRSIYNGEQGVALRAHEQSELQALLDEAQNENTEITARIDQLQRQVADLETHLNSLRVAATSKGIN